jgi:ribonuclease D
VSHLTITSQSDLLEYCGRLSHADWIAMDTEFVSEDSYRPELCLIQVASPEGLGLIDAIAIEDATPFWKMLAEGEHETIVHAGRGDLEFCLRAAEGRPKQLFDTQVAAGLVGIEYPIGLRNLILKVVGDRSKKHETRTDWRRRPLSGRQIEYALDDVRHLREITDFLQGRLTELGRTDWLRDEMERWQDDVERSIQQERWRRLSGSSGMDRKSLALARELWRWREGEAERRNTPARRVLRDDLLVELAKRQTSDPKRIRAVRGFERRNLVRVIPEIAECIAEALELPEAEWPTKAQSKPKPQLSVLGQFLFSALGSIAREAQLAPSLVGGPNDVRDLINYRTGSGHHGAPPALSVGWRADLVGNLFDNLLTGKIAVRVDDPTSDHPLAFDEVDGQTE